MAALFVWVKMNDQSRPTEAPGYTEGPKCRDSNIETVTCHLMDITNASTDPTSEVVRSINRNEANTTARLSLYPLEKRELGSYSEISHPRTCGAPG
ncbi:hypothetical protein AVEN_237290-1 [Araneus ventricosus]|uniref:Uncharacterized protein n=1 Tax=Araneus ventricosus TaxID=182803 RepID=A0A4Y2DN75_ARAVE|nr:hypothetical protein AVEN_237290-1 [Araneus ventricosus]